jgi:hypothetical protein
MSTIYPVHENSVKRPFRLWNAKENVEFRWRYYSDWHRAVNGAFVELKWADIGTVIHVIDVRFGRFLGEYKRTPNSVTFHNEVKHVKQVEA